MNDETMTHGWRDQAPSPDLRAKILNRTHDKPKRTAIRFLAFGLAGSGAAAVALSTLTLFASAPLTLAQVFNADETAGSITVVNRRIMGVGKEGYAFTITTRGVGKVVRTDTTRINPSGKSEAIGIGYSDGVETTRYSGDLHLATLDGPLKHYPYMLRRPKVSELLKDSKKATVEFNYNWNGRKVTRFTLKMKVRGTDVDQELIVDPKTKLPIRFVSMRDQRSWGDEWTYDYSSLDAKSLKPKLPEGTKVIDHREVRKQLTAWATKEGPVVFALSSPYQIAVVVDRKLIDTKKFEMPFDLTMMDKAGKPHSFHAPFRHQFDQSLKIGGREFAVLMVPQVGVGWKEGWFDGTVTGSVTLGVKKLEFSGLPMAKSGELYFLNAPFVDAYNGEHPEDDIRMQMAKVRAGG